MDAVYFILGNLTCLGLKTFWINLTWTDSDYHNAKFKIHSNSMYVFPVSAFIIQKKVPAGFR